MQRYLMGVLFFVASWGFSTGLTPSGAWAWQTVTSSLQNLGLNGGGRTVAITGTGDVISVGTLEIDTAVFQQIVVVKLAAGTGAELWRTTLHGSATSAVFGLDTLNSPTSVSVDGTGDVFVTGLIDNSTTFDASIMFYVGKLSGVDGHALWRRELFEGFAAGGVVDSAGNVVAVGSKDVGSGPRHAFVTKLSGATGADMWSAELFGSASLGNDNSANAVAIDSAGDVIVAGELENATRDFFVAKFDGGVGGLPVWKTEINGSASKTDIAGAVAVDSLDNVFAVGFLDRLSGQDLLLVKLAAADGAEMWRKELHGTLGYGDADSVAVDTADDVVVGGSILNNLPRTGVSLVIKFDGATGDEAWRHEEINGLSAGSFGVAKLDSADDVVALVGVGTKGDVAIMNLSGLDGGEAWRHVVSAKSKISIGPFALGDDGSVVSVGSIALKKDVFAMVTLTFGAQAAGKKILVQDKAGDPTKRKVQVQSADPQFVAGTPGGALDPTLVGATLTLKNPTTLETATMSLPAANWTGSGNPAGSTGYKYKDKKPFEGPCTSASIKNGQWKVSCSGAGIAFTLDEASQGSLGAKLTIGATDSCVLFGGTIKKDIQAVGKTVGVFQAQDAPAPATCP